MTGDMIWQKSLKSRIFDKFRTEWTALLCNVTNKCDEFVLNYTLTKTDIAVIIKCIIQNR